jgi:hypothetical protein
MAKPLRNNCELTPVGLSMTKYKKEKSFGKNDTMRKFKIKYDLLLFALLMVFLFVPVVQEWTGIFPVKLLKGAIEPTPKPELTFDNYRSNTYQAQAEKYVSENFGLREPVIRLYNQYVWSAYNKTYCHFIVPGKQGYLYYALAVNEHYGTELPKHFKSNEEAEQAVEKELRLMNKLRHVLKDYGIEFVAFIAPDKPEVYPEYLPRRDADTTTIHLTEYYSRRMKETGFPFINMTDWFVSMRDTVSFPLFPKTDSHWRYSAIYAFDSLFRFMNTLDGEAKFPKLHIGPPIAYESDKLEGDEETLNLMFRISGDKTKYKSDITVESDSTHRKPKVLYVGDSFIWSMAAFMPVSEILDYREVWFYNNTAFMGFDNQSKSVQDIDRLSHILNADYVVFYSAGHQWWEATYDFVEDALLQLCVSDSLFEAAVDDFTQQMRNYEDYANMTEEEVRGNMAYMLKKNPELIPGLNGDEMPTIRNTQRITEIQTINQIRKDKDWLAALSMYAVQQGLSIDDALQEEANRIAQGEPMLRDEIVVDTAAFILIKKQQIMEQWRHNPDMIEMIQQKAKDRGISFEEMLEKDAQWVINYKIEKGELFQ